MSEFNARFYWLPFPGMYQCVLTGADGSTLGEGMGASRESAEAAARQDAADDVEVT